MATVNTSIDSSQVPDIKDTFRMSFATIGLVVKTIFVVCVELPVLMALAITELKNLFK